jgi:hypothetical protein
MRRSGSSGRTVSFSNFAIVKSLWAIGFFPYFEVYAVVAEEALVQSNLEKTQKAYTTSFLGLLV